jgi:hypothetical protein
MTVIIGEETEGATAVTITLEKGYLTKRKALKTGKVVKMAIKVPSTNKATKFRLGIFKSASEKPSTFMSETGIITVAKEVALTVEGTLEAEQELVSGTEYWIGFVALDATTKFLATEKAAFGFKSTAAITELNKGTYTAGSAAFGEPSSLWGIEGGAEVKEIAGVAKIRFKDSLALGVVAELSAASKVSFKDAAALSQAVALQATTKVRFADSVALIHTPAIAGATKVRFADSAQAETVANLLAQTAVRFNAQAAVGVSASLEGSTQIRFASHAKVTLVTTGGKKVVVMIFDE